jgi:hypothetical protein
VDSGPRRDHSDRQHTLHKALHRRTLVVADVERCTRFGRDQGDSGRDADTDFVEILTRSGGHRRLLRAVAEFIQARCHPEGSLAARKHTRERNHGVTCRSEMPDLGIISEILSYDVCQLPDSDAA